MGFSHLQIPSDIKSRAAPIEIPKKQNATSSTFYPSGNLNVFGSRIKDQLNESMYSNVYNLSQFNQPERDILNQRRSEMKQR